MNLTFTVSQRFVGRRLLHRYKCHPSNVCPHAQHPLIFVLKWWFKSHIHQFYLKFLLGPNKIHEWSTLLIGYELHTTIHNIICFHWGQNDCCLLSFYTFLMSDLWTAVTNTKSLLWLLYSVQGLAVAVSDTAVWEWRVNIEAHISKIKLKTVTSDYLLHFVNHSCACEDNLNPAQEWRTPQLTIKTAI